MRLVKRFFPLFLIVLLACSLLAVNFTPTNKLTAKASTIFEDGFESGDFSAWTGTLTNGASTITVELNHPHHGSNNAIADFIGGTSYAQAYKSFAATNEMYARAYVKVDNLSTVFNADADYFSVIGLTEASNSGETYGGFIREAGVAKFVLYYRNAGAWVKKTGGSPVVDTWYCFTIYHFGNSGAGIDRLYINDVLLLEATGTDNDDRGDISHVNVGVVTNISADDVDVYVDCVVVADAYIGPEATGTNYNIDLSMATAITYTLTGQWQTKNTLTIQTPETYTTTQQWNTKTTLTLPTPLSWTTTSQTAYNLALPFTQSFTWLLHLSVTHTGVLYAVELLWSTPQTWTMQAWTGLSYILDLAWTSGFTWAIDFLNVPLAALDVLGVAAFALIIGLTALGVAALVMLKRKDAD